MGKRKDNSYIQITVTPFHVTKLNLICKRTGLTKSGVFQRLIENYNLMGVSDENIQDIIEKKK